MTRRELIARDMARKSGVCLGDYPFGSRARGGVATDLDALRSVEDPELRRRAWDLYWLLRAEQVEHVYELPSDQEELERRYP
jgi:hypothetical protein